MSIVSSNSCYKATRWIELNLAFDCILSNLPIAIKPSYSLASKLVSVSNSLNLKWFDADRPSTIIWRPYYRSHDPPRTTVVLTTYMTLPIPSKQLHPFLVLCCSHWRSDHALQNRVGSFANIFCWFRNVCLVDVVVLSVVGTAAFVVVVVVVVVTLVTIVVVVVVVVVILSLIEWFYSIRIYSPIMD